MGFNIKTFGYMFDQASGKAIVSAALRIEIVERRSIYFQNSAEPFAHKNIRSMTLTCFNKTIRKMKMR